MHLRTGRGPTANGCEPCAPGQYCVGGDEASVACGDGDWDHDGDPTTPCTPWGTTCAPGTFVAVADATHDRTCEPCPEGRFTALENQAECTPWRECAELEAQIIPGSRTGQPACLRGWTFQHFGFEGSAFEGHAVEVDAQGLIWVAAAQFAEVQDRGIESDAYLLVFGLDDGGIGGWSFGLPGDDVIHDLAIGDDGVAHVAGAIHTLGDPEEPPTDFALAFLAGIPDQYQMAFVGEGDVLITGNVSADVVFTGLASGGKRDFFLLRLSAEDGAILSLARYGTAEDDVATDLAVDAAGNVVIVGHTSGPLGPFASGGRPELFLVFVEDEG